MASQVFSGSGSFSYTNNTGQNVRIIINYLAFDSNSTYNSTMSWAGTTINLPGGVNGAIGRNLAFSSGASSANNFYFVSGGSAVGALPTEIMISNGQNFSITANSITPSAVKQYNIVVIPEAG